ncbi:MAG: DNA-directed RNA polymerase subunit alpha [Chloroflexi bacterium]|nr:MAG: DNA-directed RNA polymerase subunit alpha [Chloroflexota bacterium]
MTTKQDSPRLEIEESSQNYARFVAEPLARGFGTTIGNALRRVLLAALPGAAVVSVRIDQVQHEFSTIEHVKEDTTELLLNLRGIRLRALSDRPAKLVLDVTGERIVTAADLEVPGDYEIVNPELHIATLGAADARLTATLDVERGRGFAPADRTDGMAIGVIPMDAVFTPVRKVNYSVQPTRVGQESDLDRLILEVWTDGTINGEDAVRQAAQILDQELHLFVHLGAPPAPPEALPGETLGLTPERYNTSIEDLSLSVRAYNCLKRSGLMTVGQVLEKSDEQLLGLRNFGEKSFFEVMDRLRELGFVAQEDPRGRHGSVEGSESTDAAPDATPADPAFDDELAGEADEEISSLGTALLEALREAGQEPEKLN